jgi:ribosomal protein S18 acetylase RimI-like enzyme
MSITYRTAVPNDIAACIELRGKTRENSVSIERLKALGVTLESWSSDVAEGRVTGYLCLDAGKLAGYSFGDIPTGEVVVLALLPEWEGKGIGKHLLDTIVQDFVKLGFRRVFLGCSSNPKVRSYGFYRHLGWMSTGIFYKNSDEELEYFPNAVNNEQ